MRRPIALVALVLALLTGGYAFAQHATSRDRMTGTVLMAPSATTLLVHHEPFAGMPAMTMTFAIPAGTVVRPGDGISADVDRSSDPWSLSAIRVTRAPVPRSGALPAFLRVGDRVPDVAFVDQRGRPFSLATLRRPYAITFAYTRCQDPSMCPLVSAKLARVQRLTAGTPAHLVEVSLDPAYDRPPVLARYGAMFGADAARWSLVTGDPRRVLDFAARFGILERSAGPVTIIHSERLAIVGADDRIRGFADDARWSPADIAGRLTGAATRR